MTALFSKIFISPLYKGQILCRSHQDCDNNALTQQAFLNNLDQKLWSAAEFKSWFIDFDPVRAKATAFADSLSPAQAERAALSLISSKNPAELDRLRIDYPDQYQQLLALAQAFPSEFEEVEGFGDVSRGWVVKKIEDVIKKILVSKKYNQKTTFSESLVPVLDQGKSDIIGYHNDKAGVKVSIENPVIVFANHTCYMRLISYDFSAIQNVFAFRGEETDIYWTYLATYGKQGLTEYKGHFPDFLIKEIVVPSVELTELFGQVVKESFSKIAINDIENSFLAKTRDELLPKLLSGEV
ncbi:hypothetical protein BKG96_09455 [Rodentibacter caecimuris]|uniref:Type I restriction modification DNA specificity domain-containing protein n=1 Tax=Rodentibacter caecimuris TaxID=1796644 RepID=A0A1V3KH10_9PAST|nr:hypothetical protein [Rodentibacter heylii]OOF76904.1 hypothetical protein BKG96_09455 [Rodentibacter heylii]